MVQSNRKYKKDIAIDMRKRGFSYSEIEKAVHVPKSSLFYWLKSIKLTPEQVKKLEEKIINAAKTNAERKISKIEDAIEEIKNSSLQDIKEISKREFWLMGIILYWRGTGIKNDIHRGVHFTSSDPDLINLFLEWLRQVGGINNDEIILDIIIKEGMNSGRDKIISYWSEATGFPKSEFKHIYVQRNSPKDKGSKIKSKTTRPNIKKIRSIVQKSEQGLLRIKVRSSSLLARQIAGWIRGISKKIL